MVKHNRQHTNLGMELSNYPADRRHRFQNQIELQTLKDKLFENVVRILRDHTGNRITEKAKLKVYSLFYVDPLSAKTGFWDLFIIFIIYLFQIQISLLLGFGPGFWHEQLTAKYYITSYVSLVIVLVVDMVINFHKGYYAFGRGKVIDQPQLIVKHYFKMYFGMDIVSIGILLIPLIHSDYALNFLQLVPSVLLYFKKFKNQNEIVGMLQYKKKLRIFFILTMLGLDVLLIGHFGACIFVGIDLLLWRLQYYGNQPQYYWLSNNSMYSIDLMQGPWALQYVYAQSFSTGTLSTIAPGPFGKNPIEIWYSNLVMIFFMLLASYCAEVLVSILLSEDEIRTFHEYMHQDNIQKFDQYMKLKGVRAQISDKIHNFFELIWQNQIKMNVEDEKEVLQKLPVTLKDELIIEMQFVKHLKLMTYFNNQLLLRFVSLKVTSSIIDSDRTIFKAKTVSFEAKQRYLYHFKDGLAKFYIKIGQQKDKNKNEQTIALSNVQRTVGQFQFITGLAYSYSCKSVELCIISRLSIKDMVDSINDVGLNEEFQQLRYRLAIQRELILIDKKCIICQQHHTENNCPEVNPVKQIQEHMRRKWYRAKRKQRITYKRHNFKNKKLFNIDLKDVAKAHVIWIFMAYYGIGDFFVKLNKRQIQNFDKAEDYEKYFSEHNPGFMQQ